MLVPVSSFPVALACQTQEDTVAEQPSYQYRIPKTVINVLSLEPGTRVRLVGDVLAEVVTNPQDGVWLFLRYLAAPGRPDQVGAEEMVFAEDVLEVIETSG
jgi:hypothetical protein